MLEEQELALKSFIFRHFGPCAKNGNNHPGAARFRLFYEFSLVEIEFPYQFIGKGRKKPVHENGSFAGKG